MSCSTSDIVLSSRVRVARNIEGLLFPSVMKDEDRMILENSLKNEFPDLETYSLSSMDEMKRILLKEEKLISERCYRQGKGLVFVADKGASSIVTGDEDHIRVSSFFPSLNLLEPYDKVLKLTSRIGRHLPFAYDKSHGFITSHLDDSGVGLKASLLLHLPVLSSFDRMDLLIMEILELNLELTGFCGGTGRSLGGFFLLSGRQLKEEKDLFNLLRKGARILIGGEMEARDELVKGAFSQIEDQIFRAYGTLRYCRQISEEEALSSLSLLRLGETVGWIDDLELHQIDPLFKEIGNGFIRTFAYGENLDETDIMSIRAHIIKKQLDFA